MEEHMKDYVCSFLSRLALPGLVSLTLLSPSLALADTITTFLVSGMARNNSGMTLDSCSFLDVCTFSGMFQVDTTSGTVESSGLDITFPGLTVFDTLFFSGSMGSIWEIGTNNSLGDVLDLLWTPGSLVGFTGSTNISGSVFASNKFLYLNLSGSITPVPEPSSLVLLPGGLGWLVFGLRRRFGKHSAIH